MSPHADKIKATVAGGGSASAIAASWRRCLGLYKLDPDRDEPPRSDITALQASRRRNAALIDSAKVHLEQLFALFSHSDCTVLLADDGGYLIDLQTTRSADAWGREPAQWLGTCYSEAAVGTNSVGTCIAEQRGMIVRGDEHFLTRYTERVGIAAPLFGPDGALTGCLCVSQSTQAHDARLDNFVSISISAFARRIETELFARAYPASRLVLASPGRRLDALLAVDPDDRVVGATRGARRLLEIGDHVIARAPNVNEIFLSPPGGDELADVERRTIVRAMARCGGNHSAAAKAIGISRSTLYRKLKSYETPPAMAALPSAVKPRSSA